MTDELVTASEVAKMAGVGRAAVSNWRRRYADFPEPVGGTGVSFQRPEVERWLRGQGRLTTSTADPLWQAVGGGRGDTDVQRLVAELAAYLAGLTDGRKLARPVRDQADRLGASSRGQAVEHLVARLFERQQRQHFVTPQGLADLLVDLIGKFSGSVLDPACGPGTVLRTAAQRGARQLHGQEIDPSLAQLATARLTLALADAGPVAAGDSLRADAHADLRADVVLCDPPFGYRDWGHEDLVIDPRWEFGVPPKTEPELAWVQHCLAHTARGGTAVIVLPAGVSARRAGRGIRKEMLRAGALRAVLALPPGVLMSAGIPLHIWVLRNPEGQGADPILLVDTSHLAPDRRGRADWQAISRAVLEPWRAFRETGSVEEIPGRQRTIDVIDLLDEDVDLTPSRHLPLSAHALEVPELERECRQLATALHQVADCLPGSIEDGQRSTRSTTTVTELARAGALVVRQTVGRLETTDDAAGDGPLVLNGRDLTQGTRPSESLVKGSDAVVELRRGDVVAATMLAGDRPRAEVIDTDGWVLGRNVQLLRVDPDRVDPHFLAGLLRTTSLLRNASKSSGSLRIDFRRVEVPVIDIEEQRRIGELLRHIHLFEMALRDHAQRGRALAQHLTDGLAAGMVNFSSITNLRQAVTQTASERHHR